MHPIEAFVRNPVKVTVGVLMVALFGLIGLLRMPMQLTPEVQVPTITIETRWPGASPHEVEREIVQEQEEQLQSVQGVTKLTSTSGDSSAEIVLEFRVGTNMQEALVQVNTRLSQVPEYPPDADEPVVTLSDASDRPIAWFILGPLLPGEEEFNRFVQQYPQFRAELADVQAVIDDSPNLAQLRLDRLSRRLGVLQQVLPDDFPQSVPTTADLRQLAVAEPDLAADLQPAIDHPRDAAARLNQVIARYQALNQALDTHLLAEEKEIPKLRKFVEDFIEARFERVRGVANANVFGGREPELQVVIDPHRLASRGLTILDVRSALQLHNRDTSGGDFYEGKRRWVVRTVGQYRSVEQVREQIIAVRDGQPVYIQDVVVADGGVLLAHKKPSGVVRRFGKEHISVNAQRATGANVLEVMEGLRSAAQELNEGLLKHQGLQLTQVYDETDYIYSAIGLVNQNIVYGGLLTIVVLLIFLRSGSSTLVIALAIPTSIIGTFLILNLLGRSLNVVSLAGLAFAVGMLVDNAVVVLENVYRHCQRGEKPFRAAVSATKEVWGAVIASTLTTLAVFLPVLFVQEEAGQLFRDIALAISSAVGLSLLVSVTVIPTAAARLFRPSRFAATSQQATRFGVLAWLDRVGSYFVCWVIGINRRVQNHVVIQLLVIGLLVGTAVGTSWIMWPKVEYLPSGNRNLVFAIVLPPPGYNLDELTSLGQQVEDELRPYFDVDHDHPQAATSEFPIIRDLFYVARGRSVFMGVRAVESTRAWELVPLLQRTGAKLPGTFLVANQSSLFERGLGAGRSIDIEISGPKLEELVMLARKILGNMSDIPGGQTASAAVPGAQARPVPSADLNSPELHVVPKRMQAAEMEMDSVELGYTVNALVDGAYASDYYLGGDKIDLTIVGHAQFASQTQDLEALPVVAPNGQIVPLGAMAEVSLSSGPEQISHRERQRAITIQVNPPPEMPLQEAIARIQAGIVEPLENSGALQTKHGRYLITLSGTADKLQQTWKAMRWNIVLALLITYLLMAALFESWLHPFVIIFSVPLAAVGGVLGLFALNLYKSQVALAQGLPVPPPQALDILTMLGFVILIGTAVNNAILIVHQSLNLMRQGMASQPAILESVGTRIRPIFMTTATTCFGLAPLVFFPGAGSELYSGLGSVVLGGLLVSTVFTLVLVPAMFSLMLKVVSLSRTFFRPRGSDEPDHDLTGLSESSSIDIDGPPDAGHADVRSDDSGALKATSDRL